jgi:hypothetical protein
MVAAVFQGGEDGESLRHAVTLAEEIDIDKSSLFRHYNPDYK